MAPKLVNRVSILALALVASTIHGRVVAQTTSRSIALRASGPDVGRLATTPFQSATPVGAEVALVLRRPPTAPGSTVLPDRAALLAPEPGVPCDEPEIREFADRAIAGLDWSDERVAALLSAVAAHVRVGAEDVDDDSALAALRTRRGGPGSRVRLFVAAARAVGTPALLRRGFVFGSGGPGDVAPHVWAEVVVGPARWTIADPSDPREAQRLLRIALSDGDASPSSAVPSIAFRRDGVRVPPFAVQERPAIEPARIDALEGIGAYGVYVGGRKVGGAIFEYMRSGSAVDPTWTFRSVMTSAAPYGVGEQVETEERVFDGVPPYLLRSARTVDERSGTFVTLSSDRKSIRFEQNEYGAKFFVENGLPNDGAIDASFVDYTLVDLAADRLILRPNATVGDTLDGAWFDLNEALAARRAGGATGGTPLRPKSSARVLRSIDPTSVEARYVVHVLRPESGGVCETRVCSAEGWLTRSDPPDARSSSPMSMIAESIEMAETPFDRDGRFSAAIRLRTPADAPDFVESLVVRFPPPLAGLLDESGVGKAVRTDDGYTVIECLRGDRPLPADRRSEFVPAPAAASRPALRARVAEIRAAKRGPPLSTSLRRAENLADALRAADVPCRVVSGLAIIDRAGESLEPHFWVECADGDAAFSVDPAAANFPAPPTRIPLLQPDASMRRALRGRFNYEAAVVSFTARPCVVPDVRALGGVTRRIFSGGPRPGAAALRMMIAGAGATDLPSALAKELGEDAPKMIEAYDEERRRAPAALPGALPLKRRAQYALLGTLAPILRNVAVRDLYSKDDVAYVQVVLDYAKALDMPPQIELDPNDPESARAVVRAIGLWMEERLREAPILAALSNDLDHGPYVGFAAPLDMPFDETVAAYDAGPVRLTLGRALVDGVLHSVLKARRGDADVWARVICDGGGTPLAELEFRQDAVESLGAFGYRATLSDGEAVRVFLSKDGAFLFYFRSW